MYELVGPLGPSVQSGRSPKLISSPAQPAPELVQRKIRVGLAIQLVCEPTFPGGEYAAGVAGQSSPFFGVFWRELLSLGGELLKACLFDGCPGPVEVFSATDGGRPTQLCGPPFCCRVERLWGCRAIVRGAGEDLAKRLPIRHKITVRHGHKGSK